MINWRVRIRNKAFWIAFIPSVLMVVQYVLAFFGVSFDATTVSNELIALVGAIFSVLAMLGVVNDPTTAGMSDSKQALTYDKPKKDKYIE
jgi:phi LC3 family holin